MKNCLDSYVSKSTIVIAEEGFELAKIVTGGSHTQAVAIELEHSPEKKVFKN